VKQLFCEAVKSRRWWQTWGAWIFASAIVATLVASVVYASQGTPDLTDSTRAEPHAVVLANSAIIVFREGLEAVLILAAVMAPMLGARDRLGRPVAAGAALGFAAAVGTWFVAQAILSRFAEYGDRLQAVTGLLAIAVLLVVMNWFFQGLLD
jgi:high-affinity iron transporter